MRFVMVYNDTAKSNYKAFDKNTSLFRKTSVENFHQIS